ncbi:DUF3098 domain-containing protein [Myroides injenensis]|uniref:DUF3098 domain-containing protein n=1 Tax=Myroides injenensis TaxID=1183151 RepID=UPI00028991CD|nr:DUF3098 domain-containing protein [Myroides injenensis]
MKEQDKNTFLFTKQNYIWLIISLLIIALSFILMSGASNDDPTQFNEAIYSFRRIHLAPTLFFVGIGVAIYSIFKK